MFLNLYIYLFGIMNVKILHSAPLKICYTESVPAKKIMPVDVQLQLFCSKSWSYLLINFIFRNIYALCCISEHIRATTNDDLLLLIDQWIIFSIIQRVVWFFKILESGGKWLLKPKMTSSSVWICPPDKDIHSAVTEEERDQNTFTFKKLKWR